MMYQEADKAIYLTGVRARVSLFLVDVTLPNATLANAAAAAGGNGTGANTPDVPRYEIALNFAPPLPSSFFEFCLTLQRTQPRIRHLMKQIESAVG